MTTTDIPTLIKARAYAYATQQGMDDARARAFADVAAAIAYSESRFDPAAIGDNGASAGLFQLHERGRGQGMTVAQRQDPETNIARSLPELFGAFVQTGAVATPQAVAEVSRIAQRPLASAWQAAVQRGEFANALRVAQGAGGGAGSTIAPVTGTADAARTTGSRPAVAVNPTPVQGGITSRFGEPFPLDSGKTYQGQAYQNFNSGVDYGVSGGTPVQAVVGGTVKLAADDGQGWGPRVVIVDSEGFEHSYGHLGQLNVQPGQQVQAGQVIGAVGAGQVGVSTGAHLSYDIFRNGEPVDPSPWLGQNVRAEGIPAGQQAPSYLAGGAAAGGAGMVTTGAAGTGGGFNQQQLARAQQDYAYWQQRAAELRAKPSLTPDEQNELDAIAGDGVTTSGLLGEAMDRIAAFSKLQGDEPAQAGRDPIAAAQAIAQIQQGQSAQNLDIFNTFMGLIDKTFTNQLGVSGLLRDIFNLNEQNAQAAVASRMQRGQLDLSGRNDIIQAQAMQQAAEIARAGEALARAQWINETDFRNLERQLPPGTHYVPGLEPTGPLMASLSRLGLPAPGLAATPVDWSTVDPRRSLADAETTLKPTPEFDIAGLRQTVAQNEQIAPYTPGTLTPQQIGVPQAPDLTQFAPQLSAIAGQQGTVSNDQLIDMILGRNQFAPAPPAAQPATVTTAAAPPPTQAGSAPAAEATRAAAAALGPGQGFTNGTDLAAPVQQPGVQTQPGAPRNVNPSVPVTQQPKEDEENPILKLLRQFEIPALSSPLTTGTAAVRQGLKWIR